MSSNEDSKFNYTNSASGLMSGSIFMMALGWFIYGGFDGAFGLALFSSLVMMSLLIALIPFGIGVILQAVVIFMWIVPTLFNISGIFHTWITWVIICISILFGIIFNILTTIGVLSIEL